MHNLMEHAQRKAFLDTRNCIAARLEMEDENEKLVSNRVAFLMDFSQSAYGSAIGTSSYQYPARTNEIRCYREL